MRRKTIATVVACVALISASVIVRAASDPPGGTWERLALEFLATPGAKSESNALADYLAAYQSVPVDVLKGNEAVARKMILEGWTSDQPALTRIVEAAQPTIERIRAGNAKPLILYPKLEMSAWTPMPDYGRIRDLQTLLALSGRKREAEKNFEGAISEYKHLMIFGSRQTWPDCGLLPELLANGMMKAGAERMKILIEADMLGTAELEAAAKALEPFLLQSHSGAQCGRSELAAIGKMIENPLEEIPTEAVELSQLREDLGDEQKRARIRADLDALVQAATEYFEKPWSWESADALEKSVKSLDKGLRHLIPNFVEARAREHYKLVTIRLTAVGAKLRLAHRAKGEWPKSLEGLGISEAALADPFGNGSLEYRPEAGAVRIYSVGPDGKDESGATDFDYGKGLKSAGDIVCRLAVK